MNIRQHELSLVNEWSLQLIVLGSIDCWIIQVIRLTTSVHIIIVDFCALKFYVLDPNRPPSSAKIATPNPVLAGSHPASKHETRKSTVLLPTPPCRTPWGVIFADSVTGEYVPYRKTTADVPTSGLPKLPRLTRNMGPGTMTATKSTTMATRQVPFCPHYGILIGFAVDAVDAVDAVGEEPRESHRLVSCPDEEVTNDIIFVVISNFATTKLGDIRRNQKYGVDTHLLTDFKLQL